jgi:UDP-N-acetylmuramyl pentapeptide phosphotransferase/UDP-N-acetylglucosamine-1-phosphate transferase
MFRSFPVPCPLEPTGSALEAFGVAMGKSLVRMSSVQQRHGTREPQEGRVCYLGGFQYLLSFCSRTQLKHRLEIKDFKAMWISCFVFLQFSLISLITEFVGVASLCQRLLLGQSCLSIIHLFDS